jgi:hypothetical protein
MKKKWSKEEIRKHRQQVDKNIKEMGLNERKTISNNSNNS